MQMHRRIQSKRLKGVDIMTETTQSQVVLEIADGLVTRIEVDGVDITQTISTMRLDTTSGKVMIFAELKPTKIKLTGTMDVIKSDSNV